MSEKPHILWRGYAAYFLAHRAVLAAVTLAGAAQAFLYVPLAALLRQIFDVILPGRDPRALWIAVSELLVLQVAGLVVFWWIQTRALRASQAMLSQLRRQCIHRLYELPRDFHTNVDVERLHVTMVHETYWIDAMNQALTARILPAGLSCMVLFGILFWIEPRYALIIGITAPALFTVNRLMVRRAWFRQERLRQAFEEFSRGVRFVISAMDLTRSQAAEDQEMARQNAHVENLRRVSLDLSRFDSAQQLVQTSLLLASTLAVLLAGGWAVASGRVTRGEIMAFYVVAALFATQSRSIVESIPATRMGMRAFARIADLLSVPEREPYQGAAGLAAIEELRVEGVSFGYGDGPSVIEEASLVIRRGEKTALIGSNGSGKSTLLFLIAGYYQPRRGSLSINGTAYGEWNPRSIRSRMAIIPQDPFLFADTIRANVVYGNQGASTEAIWEALRWAGAAAFVSGLPDALDTNIGEQGVRLSGGQRQRLVIARALLRRPDLLILDEPTNHLDNEGIVGLMESLDNLPFHPAVILISHEWRALCHAERAWRLVNGRLEETAVGCST